MKRRLAVMLALAVLGLGQGFAQERTDKPSPDKPAKPESKPPSFGRGFGFGWFRPPANREEAIQRTRQQLEQARNMVKQLEGILSRLESEGRPAGSKPGEARRDERPREKPPAAVQGRSESSRRDSHHHARPFGKPFGAPSAARHPDHGRRPGPGGAFRGGVGRWRAWGFGPGWWWGRPPAFGRWSQFGRFGPPAPPGWGWPPRPPFSRPSYRTPQPPGRFSDIESRLDRIARELEQLRRELRERR